MGPEWIVIGFCLCAIVALLLNLKKKLPKAVFMFLAVALVVSVTWYSFEKDAKPAPSSSSQKSEDKKVKLVYFEAAKGVLLSSGKETRIALPIAVSGKRELDSVRFLFEVKDGTFTEQSFLEKVNFSLLFSGESIVPASGIVFAKEEDSIFPNKFVLKVFFRTPENIYSKDIRCIVENNLGQPLIAKEISVGSVPLDGEC